MNDYRFFADILEANIRDILLLLPMEFTAKQFIDATRSLLPNEYANVLSGRSYKSSMRGYQGGICKAFPKGGK